MKRNSPIAHESGTKHVSGEAIYVDDIHVNDQLLIGRVVYSSHAHARIVSFNLEKAKKVPGVHAVLSCEDIPGPNQMGPVVKDELCLAEGEVICVGQAMFLIAAETEEQCIAAERLINVNYSPLEPILTIEKAIEANSLLGPPAMFHRGDVENALRSSPHRISDELAIGAQEHWYLESQVCLCVPGEEKEMNVFSSTQHPSETQSLIAELLGVGKNEVVVEVRRMGGAFGGKETQANHTACWTA
ncbi:MAG TPA: molybdopterin cofactor-binding domain-containing protein, partial [Bacteroidota bacterium]|nr:molybdopterin cofactor-binding domain-containing protein [Bacteroidota bacterium]